MRWIVIFGMNVVLLSGVTEPLDAEEIICSEYGSVCFQVLRGAPASITIDGKSTTYRGGRGEVNERSGGRLMCPCGYLFPVSTPVVDVTPDAPKPGEPLECKVVVKSDRLGVELVEDYVYTWKRFEPPREGEKDGKWADAEAPRGPKLTAGMTKDGERWACLVEPLDKDGKPTKGAGRQDEVEIGKTKPGDSRKNDYWGWVFGQWRHSRGYLKFDVSALAGKKIKSVKLRFFCDVQMPAVELRALPSSNDWKVNEITWINQPVKFPYDDQPIAVVTLQMGPEPTDDNPVTPGDTWYSHGPKWGEKRAPDWREMDITEYVKGAVAKGDKELSICLACTRHSGNDHKRIPIFGDKHLKGEKDRGDMRPRLQVETE